MSGFPLSRHNKCVVRQQNCGRIFSASKIAFIACPGAESVALELAVIKTILERNNIEPYVAIENYDPAKDVFCEKICTKIIESKLCVVLLTDPLLPEGYTSPNPNVYYEYGLMTAFGKNIIPLQRKEHDLAFNVRSLDTIKFTNFDLKKIFEKVLTETLGNVYEAEKSSIGTEESIKAMHLYMERNGYGKKNTMIAHGTPFKHFAKPDASATRYGIVTRNRNDIPTLEQGLLLLLSRHQNVLEDKKYRLNNKFWNLYEAAKHNNKKMIKETSSVKTLQDQIDAMEKNTEIIIICPNDETIKSEIEHKVSKITPQYFLKIIVYCLNDLPMNNGA